MMKERFFPPRPWVPFKYCDNGTFSVSDMEKVHESSRNTCKFPPGTVVRCSNIPVFHLRRSGVYFHVLPTPGDTPPWLVSRIRDSWTSGGLIVTGGRSPTLGLRLYRCCPRDHESSRYKIRLLALKGGPLFTLGFPWYLCGLLAYFFQSDGPFSLYPLQFPIPPNLNS